MAEYEVEFGTVTERYDARTADVLSVDVETYVRPVDSAPGPGDTSPDEYVVRFRIEDDTAVFESCEAETGGPTTRRALNAVVAAAAELRDLDPDYEVPDPLASVRDDELTVVDAIG
ncbi:MAG: hypothetical protein ABEH47_02260 [Haloferacaceae archaeon]